MSNSFVIFTGGTGGHVFPAVSFGNFLIKKGFKCILITDNRGKKYTKKFIGEIKTIHASHLSGSYFFKILAIIKLFLGFFESLYFLYRIKPKIAVSFGSYASLPPCFVIKIITYIYKIDFYIHEQNSIIGRSNNFFIKNANRMFVNFDKDYELPIKYNNKINVVGLPKIENNNKNDIKIFDNNKKFTIFIYGGSQGSIQIIKFFERLLTKFNKYELRSILFIIQCPDNYLDDIKNNIKKYHFDYYIKDFFYNLPELLKNTDLIISRCGAGTIHDIIYFKIPSILIPLPFSKDNHQYENATYLIKKKCGILIDQNNFNLIKAYDFIKQFLKNKNKKEEIKNKLSQEIFLETNKLMLNVIKNENSK